MYACLMAFRSLVEAKTTYLKLVRLNLDEYHAEFEKKVWAKEIAQTMRLLAPD